MSITKKTASLSLAVLISLGAVGCSAVNPGNEAPKSQEASSSAPKVDTVQVEAVKTLNEVKAIGDSAEYKALFDKMDTIKPEDPDYIKQAEAALDEHRDMINRIDALIEMSPEFIKEQQAFVAMSQSSSGMKMSEKVFNDAMVISTVEGLKQSNETSRDAFVSYGATTDAVKDGSLDTTGVYLKDKNGGILDFLDLGEMGLSVKDSGKKLVIEKASTASKTSALLSDIKNAATQVETWIVSQNGASTPLVVEGNEIVSGDKEARQNHNFYIKTSEGVNLEFTGDSYNYVITGTVEGSDEKVVYDSAKGGLQGNESFKPGSYDSKAFSNFTKDAGDFKSLEEYVKNLNDKGSNNAVKYEVVQKDGSDYVKVADPKSKISEKEILFASPLK